MEQTLHALRARLHEIDDLNRAAAVLAWDQQTQLPPSGGAGRGRQLATLQRLSHERLTDPGMGELLEALRAVEQELDAASPDSDDAAMIRVARRDYERATRLPSEFVAEVAEHCAVSFDVWTRARPANDFAAVRPYLERGVALARQYAGYFPGHAHIADPLIDQADEGMSVATLQPLFAALREQLVPLVRAIGARPQPESAFLYREYPEAQQMELGREAARLVGYDFERGRLDLTHHPFAISFGLGDVRITTRIKTNDFSEGLFGTLHEAGHAMYEQGIGEAYAGTLLASGTSLGVHESQSRLWENQVGRSRAFWQFFYPRVQSAFPQQLGGVTLDAFHKAVNRVQPSLIRVEADEVTYNLHVIIRFDLELALLTGELAVADLPAAWHDRYQSDLGLRAPDDRDGVLQDVHWYGDLPGGCFQSYTLGNVLSAQIFERARLALPDLDAQMARGEFGGLHAWLVEQVYRHGRKYPPSELIARVTGGPLRIEPYITYLTQKYGALYGVS
jgi:carboxypeptidase Taq